MAHDRQELVEDAIRLDSDVIAADIGTRVLTGIEAAPRLHDAGSRARFVFLTVHSDYEFVRACMAEGALGDAMKSHMGTDLIPAIKAASRGQSYISQSFSR